MGLNDGSTKPIVSMNFDCIGGLGAPSRFREFLADLLMRCKDHGVSRVMYRTSACGHVYYPSKIMTPVFGHPWIDVARRNQVWMRQGDPFQVFCEEARRLDLENFVWITTFDSFYPGFADPYLSNERPDLLMRSKPGAGQSEGLRGIPCYAEPETVAYRLAEAREVASYDVDGIFYSLRSHSGHTRRKKDIEGEWTFGFNAPVVARYRELYGVDICTERIDSEALRKLHGEFYADFLRQVRDILHPQGRRLIAMADPKGWRGYIWGNQVMIETPFNQWLDDGVVDEVCLESGHELICDHLLETLDLKFNDPHRTLLWVYSSKIEQMGDEIGQGLELCDKYGLRGITVHEASHFLNPESELWELLGQGAQ